MAVSSRTTARVTLATEADATPLVEAREKLKLSVSAAWGFAPSYNDLIALVVARSLGEFPYMNARLVDDGTAVQRIGSINLGMAVDTERGLLVPVIRNADTKGLRSIAVEFRELTARAREGRALPDDLSGGTFTITNLGMYEIDAFTPIINLPEAAILGVGRIHAKPVVYAGEIVVRKTVALSLAFDHRLVDGAPAARFLQHIKQLVENPFLLLA
jgi:pyruvate dehydrogenase E2 component (dihydrolipoamide acetyltransferase)